MEHVELQITQKHKTHIRPQSSNKITSKLSQFN